MIRKRQAAGKNVSHSYALEYGTDTIEISGGGFSRANAPCADDLLATGHGRGGACPRAANDITVSSAALLSS